MKIAAIFAALGVSVGAAEQCVPIQNSDELRCQVEITAPIPIVIESEAASFGQRWVAMASLGMRSLGYSMSSARLLKQSIKQESRAPTNWAHSASVIGQVWRDDNGRRFELSATPHELAEGSLGEWVQRARDELVRARPYYLCTADRMLLATAMRYRKRAGGQVVAAEWVRLQDASGTAAGVRELDLPSAQLTYLITIEVERLPNIESMNSN